MPAPRFIGLAGLVGFQLRGWWGSLVAVLSLLLPSSLMFLGVVMLLSGRPLPPVWEALQRSVSLAVVGVLLGNAWRQASGPSLRFRTRLLGVLLSASVAVAVHRGVPLGAVALGGLVVGWWLLREESP